MEHWIQILEDHFTHRKKAFLVFDNQHICLRISEYASEVLELEENQVGISSIKDIFELPRQVPDLLLDPNDTAQAVYDITYTTPSGRPKDIRISLEQYNVHSGYVVWIEEKSRDLTTMVSKVSPFNPFKRLKPFFDKLDIAYLILNKDGIIEDYNQSFKHILQLPGEWLGRNIFTFPTVHENKLGVFFLNSIQENDYLQTKLFNFRYRKTDQRIKIRWTGISLTDLRGTSIGAMICAKPESRRKE